ncbi:MAG: biosynthetic-type acetolactate synthase large subunit [Mariprofundaceae bacterium]|nr:biosynthetic-type acetolactate synthase large subunit [Mariprofundaceae bacterium]
MKLTGAQIFVECLKREGVELIFGYPGGSVLNIYDEIFKQNHFQHILVRHEQAALHAANGYARVSGRCGVALVTSGPGATNAVTGLADSNMDSIPTVCFSGQAPSALIGNDAFQEADTVGITRSVTKHNFLVKDVRELAHVIRQAFYIATTGRPGAVLVDIPKDITQDRCEFIYPETVDIRSYKPTRKGNHRQIKKIADKISQAKRPVLYTGGGVISAAGAAPLLTQLVDQLNLPITNTLMGLGGVSCDNPHFLGMLGMHGTYEANMAVSHCDVLFAIGARFDDRVTARLDAFAPDAHVIHIDVDPSSISKNIHAHTSVVGDVAVVLKQLLNELAEHTNDETVDLAPWWHEIEQWRAVKSLAYDQKPDEPIKPQLVIQSVHKITHGDAIVATDVGQHQMWTAQFYGFKEPNRWLTSGGLGTMGYGLPAAMGAQLVAKPGERVVLFSGDASIQMCIQELSTLYQYKLPVVVIILNNGYMGMVRQWQEMFYDSRYSHSYFDSLPDFVKLADAYGGLGLRVDDLSELDATLQQAFDETKRFVLVDVHVAKTENVYPMVPAGAALYEMKLGKEER